MGKLHRGACAHPKLDIYFFKHENEFLCRFPQRSTYVHTLKSRLYTIVVCVMACNSWCRKRSRVHVYLRTNHSYLWTAVVDTV